MILFNYSEGIFICLEEWRHDTKVRERSSCNESETNYDKDGGSLAVAGAERESSKETINTRSVKLNNPMNSLSLSICLPS
jgi:hypothetical protein